MIPQPHPAASFSGRTSRRMPWFSPETRDSSDPLPIATILFKIPRWKCLRGFLSLWSRCSSIFARWVKPLGRCNTAVASLAPTCLFLSFGSVSMRKLKPNALVSGAGTEITRVELNLPSGPLFVGFFFFLFFCFAE